MLQRDQLHSETLGEDDQAALLEHAESVTVDGHQRIEPLDVLEHLGYNNIQIVSMLHVHQLLLAEVDLDI